MPTYIHLVRHAQGFHNLCEANHSLSDPDLTPLGKEQCAHLAKTFPHHNQVTHLLASPLRRTLYTCLLSFAPALDHLKSQGGGEGEVKITALPDLQEVSPLPCDTGSPPSALSKEFDGEVDFTQVSDGWNDKISASSPYEPEMEKLEARARRARNWMREVGREWENAGRGDAHIVAVTHGGFLHFLTGIDGVRIEKGTGWENTEWRTYEFVEGVMGKGGDDGEARLRETGEVGGGGGE
ncbi:hypothetical protein N0V88_000832 [Collariella sp. IMI 366227]|nr:hypothetical protein N0V88_000832 [Collariella sp. IMI 366227]